MLLDRIITMTERIKIICFRKVKTCELKKGLLLLIINQLLAMYKWVDIQGS